MAGQQAHMQQQTRISTGTSAPLLLLLSSPHLSSFALEQRLAEVRVVGWSRTHSGQSTSSSSSSSVERSSSVVATSVCHHDDGVELLSSSSSSSVAMSVAPSAEAAVDIASIGPYEPLGMYPHVCMHPLDPSSVSRGGRAHAARSRDGALSARPSIVCLT